MINKIILYVIIINLTAFFVYAMDKRLAIKGSARVSERTLIFAALAGGSVGAFLAMQIFRHKTRHTKFTVGIPIIFALQLLLLYVLWQMGVLA